MPEKPVLIQNLTPGPTEFSEDGTKRFSWAGVGDPEGMDLQVVPYEIATSNPDFLRALAKGVFGVASDNEERVKNTIAASMERFKRPPKPGEEVDESLSEWDRKFQNLTCVEMNEELTKAGKIGQDREDHIPVLVETPVKRR